MMHKVGPKGQVVIAKEIRDQLGVKPGCLVIQRLVDDHVEIHFVPPPQRRSLRGVLTPHTKVRIPPEQWREAVERAWDEAIDEGVDVRQTLAE